MAKRYQRGNQNLYIEEEQKTQWSKDTKGVIRICISKKNRKHIGQKIPKGYLLTFVFSVLLWYTDSDYPFGIFWSLCFLFFYDIQILITPLVSFGHCVFCSSSIYRFWLPLWYLLTIVFSVLLWYTDSDYPFGIFWSLCFLFFYDILNQNLYIIEEQNTQWPKDTKGVIRICISKKNRKHNGQKIPKG
jgi:hypothetical protein